MHAADHIWSSNLSPPFVERFMLVDNKTPCDRLINSSSALLTFDVVSFFFFFFVASDIVPLQLHVVTIRYGLMLLILLTVVISSEKLVSGESPEHPIWKLTDPVPLDDDGSSVEAVLGQNPDIHYIYICTKVDSKFLILALFTFILETLWLVIYILELGKWSVI